MKKFTLLIVLFLCAAVVSAKEAPQTFTVKDEVANALRAVALLREAMRDPDSLVIEHVYALMSHKVDQPFLCIAYRGRNAFNGYDREIARYKGHELSAEGSDSFTTSCGDILRGWNRAANHGWAEITDEYTKAAKDRDKHQ